MALTFKDIEKNLEKVYQEMLSASLEIGLIGYIGGTPLIVSDFFSNKFRCNSLNLPSTKIEGDLSKHIAFARFIYGSFPESFRKPVSYTYRYYRKNRRTIFPEINGELEQLSKEENKGVLLVDDNTYTGRTMKFWKREILNIQGIVPKTFAITVIGDYRPDYYCFDSWKSFDWRPVGV